MADGPPSTIQISSNGHNGYYQQDPYFAPIVSPVREDAPTRILCFIDDLFFQAKINETSKKLGVKVEDVYKRQAVVLGAQWGDEGKGKIVDVLSERFSAVARYAGGHNAGHTVIANGQKMVLQLIPCGILRAGCKNVIGNGVVLDPIFLLAEAQKLRDAGIEVDDRLFISNRAQVILPYHRMIELAAESAPGRRKIGTTSKGIGPAYEDKMSRGGLRVVDLLRRDLLKTHIETACAEKNAIARALFGTCLLYTSRTLPDATRPCAGREWRRATPPTKTCRWGPRRGDLTGRSCPEWERPGALRRWQRRR